MTAPEGTPEEIYRLMLQCWQYQPENRPHFDKINTIMESLVKSLRYIVIYNIFILNMTNIVITV
jgi:tyrosine-protein kinase Fer